MEQSQGYILRKKSKLYCQQREEDSLSPDKTSKGLWAQGELAEWYLPKIKIIKATFARQKACLAPLWPELQKIKMRPTWTTLPAPKPWFSKLLRADTEGAMCAQGTSGWQFTERVGARPSSVARLSGSAWGLTNRRGDMVKSWLDGSKACYKTHMMLGFRELGNNPLLCLALHKLLLNFFMLSTLGFHILKESVEIGKGP